MDRLWRAESSRPRGKGLWLLVAIVRPEMASSTRECVDLNAAGMRDAVKAPPDVVIDPRTIARATDPAGCQRDIVGLNPSRFDPRVADRPMAVALEAVIARWVANQIHEQAAS